MDILVAFFAHGHQVGVIIGKPQALLRIIRRHERNDVVDVLRRRRNSLSSAYLAERVVYKFDVAQALPTAAIVNHAALGIIAAVAFIGFPRFEDSRHKVKYLVVFRLYRFGRISFGIGIGNTR